MNATLPLFAYTPPAPATPPEHEAVLYEVKALEPDNLTPKQALEVLYKLKKLAQ